MWMAKFKDAVISIALEVCTSSLQLLLNADEFLKVLVFFF